jgi:hypothetical protein
MNEWVLKRVSVEEHFQLLNFFVNKKSDKISETFG